MPQRIRQQKKKQALTAGALRRQSAHIDPNNNTSQPALAFTTHACLDWEGFYINLLPIILLVGLQVCSIMDTTTHPITTDFGAQLSGAINALAESAVELTPSWPYPERGFDSYAQGLTMSDPFSAVMYDAKFVPRTCQPQQIAPSITNSTGFYHQIVLPLRD